MTSFTGVSFTLLFISLGIYPVEFCECRPTNSPGSVTHTKITNFPDIYTQLANPCGIVPAPAEVISLTTTAAPTLSTNTVNIMDFYHSLESALRLASQKLARLLSEDPSLPECNGITLDSLPITPLMDNMNNGQAIKQAYKTSLYLATHFHLISLDRQMSVVSREPIVADQESLPERSLPDSRFQYCGNETSRFPVNLQEVTTSLENVLCTIVSSATNEQRESFWEPLRSLQNTILYRYHTSWSTLQTRDCLVFKEANQALTMISRKYNQLISQSNDVLDNENDNGIDNHI